MRHTFDVTPRLASILERLCITFERILLAEDTQLEEILKIKEIILMGQAEFDAQIAVANEKLDTIGAGLTAIETGISNETQEIKDFIASLPPETNTSALDGVVSRLDSTATKAGEMAAAVGGIFTAPAAPEA